MRKQNGNKIWQNTPRHTDNKVPIISVLQYLQKQKY